MQSNETLNGLKIAVTPNPSSNYFIVTTRSNSDKQINIKVMDAAGKTVETDLNLAANSTTQIGAKLTAGVYFVEVSQDRQKQRVKLVKQ